MIDLVHFKNNRHYLKTLSTNMYTFIRMLHLEFGSKDFVSEQYQATVYKSFDCAPRNLITMTYYDHDFLRHR